MAPPAAAAIIQPGTLGQERRGEWEGSDGDISTLARSNALLNYTHTYIHTYIRSRRAWL